MYSRDVAVDSSGNVYVTGSTVGDLDGNLSAGFTDMFVVKYDNSGNEHWNLTWEGYDFDVCLTIALDSLNKAPHSPHQINLVECLSLFQDNLLPDLLSIKKIN